ncbi:MAG: autotransporter outer membrane beta-barrel domain-containing protein [Rickettsiales bacterium]|nr:autotransporter outer membrane beta-barrel domain-containing protein [Rickettsiales bacterium]
MALTAGYATDVPDWNNGIVQGDFVMNGGSSNTNAIAVCDGNSLNVNSNGQSVNGVTFTIINGITVDKDLLHNSGLASSGSGSFAILGDNTTISAGGNVVIGGAITAGGKKLTLGGASIQADSLNAKTTSDLVLNTDVISVQHAIFESGSITTVNSNLANASLSASDSVSINGGLYMGDSTAETTDIVQIVSASDNNVYTVSATNTLDISGGVNADKGKLVINGNTVKIAKDVSGQVDFGVDNLNIGGSSLNSDTSLDWQDRLTNYGTGDLYADGTLISENDILIGGNVDGELNIASNAGDMWVGEDLQGYLSIDVNNLYVLGNISSAGNIKADTVNVGEDLTGDSGGLLIQADSVNVGGDLSGDLKIDADKINVNHDVLGGAKFRPNLPGNDSTGDAETDFHVSPNGSAYNGSTGKYDLFKQTDLSVAGTYFFNNDSYLQLVLNSKTAASNGSADYDYSLDDALMTVGGFDASGVTLSPDFSDMDSYPNIEILVDNLDQTIPKIKLISVTGNGILKLGSLDFAGLWFYWDKDNDGVADMRLFQETKLVAESNNVYAIVAMMDSIESLTRLAPASDGNDIQVAAAVDDLILHRLRGYAGYSNDDLNNYYTSVMRILFPNSDIYYDLMLSGGSARDAADVMVSQNPNYALDFVRSIGLGSIEDIGNKLYVSGRVSRNAVADQLIEDFTWIRYLDKRVGWLRMGFGGDVASFNFGADAKIKKFIAGFNFGHNRMDFGNLDGSTMNFGLYGAYEWKKWARLYANANLAVHSARAKTNSLIVGEIASEFSTADTTLDVGILHKIFDQYVSGRGYLTFGVQGGYGFTQRYKGGDFMDVSSSGRVVLAPGYEIALGKDIWLSVGSFMRPSFRLGVEYDLLGNASRDLDFKFSEVENWHRWMASDSEGLWLRFGGQLDFSFIVGTNVSIGYEVLRNGDFKANQFKLSGAYRF